MSSVMAEAEDLPFEIMEHTADVGVTVHGASLAEVFAKAAVALFSLMVTLAGVQEREERQIEVEARDWEGLLVNWLSELLYYLDAQELLFRRFEILELEPYRVRAKAFGERIDRERHELHFGVKAVTRHLLELGKADGGYRAQVLFDI